MSDNTVMFQASQAPIHNALLEGTHHRSGGLDPALRHHTGNGEAALDFGTAPVLQGLVIIDEEPVPASPAHISILAAFIQDKTRYDRFSHLPKTSQLSEVPNSQSLIGYSLISQQDIYLIVIDNTLFGRNEIKGLGSGCAFGHRHMVSGN
ncbi:MAG: hypothetical protein WBN94_01290 [Methanothrix sp.]